MQRILVVVLAALALAACSKQPAEITANDQVPADQRTTSATEGAGGATEGAGGSDPTWVAVDIDYEAAPEAVPAGEVPITLVNNGAAIHDVTFDELDETIVTANGGETAEGTTTLEAGEYTYYCSIPGHREAGMEGTLVVE